MKGPRSVGEGKEEDDKEDEEPMGDRHLHQLRKKKGNKEKRRYRGKSSEKKKDH